MKEDVVQEEVQVAEVKIEVLFAVVREPKRGEIGEDTPAKPKRVASGNGAKKRQGRKKAEPKKGISKDGKEQQTPTPGYDLGLSEINKYTKKLKSGTILVETNPTFGNALIPYAAPDSKIREIIARRNWIFEIRDADELETMIIFIGATMNTMKAKKKEDPKFKVKPTCRALARMLNKLVECRKLF
jgi:hypothetical protein